MADRMLPEPHDKMINANQMFGYTCETMLSSYISFIILLLSLLAICSPFLFVANNSSNTLSNMDFGLQYYCHDTSYTCKNVLDLPDGSVKNDLTFALSFYWAGIFVIFVAWITGLNGIIKHFIHLRTYCAMAFLHVVVAGLFCVTGLTVEGNVYVHHHESTIKDYKNSLNGNWSFSYYAIWITCGLSLFNSLFIGYAAWTEPKFVPEFSESDYAPKQLHIEQQFPPPLVMEYVEPPQEVPLTTSHLRGYEGRQVDPRDRFCSC
jgi:hypothetical protein